MDEGESILPPEVITEILSRLPVKPLLRFRSVSKRFCSLINSPYFVKKHHNHSSTAKTRILVSNSMRSLVYSVDHYYCEQHSFETTVTQLYPPNIVKTRNVDVLGSCHGLILLSPRQDNLILWNPTTRKHRMLPPIYPVRPVPVQMASCVIYNTSFAIGHVSQTNDYRVMKIRQLFGYDFKISLTEVDVYSLRSNSWRRVECFPDEDLLRSVALVNECFNWAFTLKHENPNNCYGHIVSFDIGCESIRKFALPYANIAGGEVSVQAFGGSLCAFIKFDNVRLELWMMKEYGVKESWTKLFNVDDSNTCELSRYSSLELITYYRDCGKVLFHRFFGGKDDIISYDLVSKTVEKVDIRDLPKRFGVMAYSESLVNPNAEDLRDGEKKLTLAEGKGHHQKKKEKKENKN